MKTINTIGMAIIPTRKENIAKKQKQNNPTDINIKVNIAPIIAKTICIKNSIIFNILPHAHSVKKLLTKTHDK